MSKAEEISKKSDFGNINVKVVYYTPYYNSIPLKSYIKVKSGSIW